MGQVHKTNSHNRIYQLSSIFDALTLDHSTKLTYILLSDWQPKWTRSLEFNIRRSDLDKKLIRPDSKPIPLEIRLINTNHVCIPQINLLVTKRTYLIAWSQSNPTQLNIPPTYYEPTRRIYAACVPGLILNLGILGCRLEINLIGWSVDCRCRSVAEMSCN